MKSRKVDQVKWGVILTYATLFLNIVISVLYTPVMLRTLGSSEHGLYSTVSSTIAWLSLLNLGLNSSYIRFYARYKTENKEDKIASLNGMFLVIFCILGLIALLCGLFISNHLDAIFADGLTAQEYRIARVLSIIVTVEMAIGFPATVFNAIIRAKEKFITVRLVHLFQSLASPLITLPLLLMGYGSIAMVAVTTMVNAIAYTYYVFFCFKKLRTRFRFSHFEGGLIKEIAAYSAVIAVNSLINQTNTNLDKMLLARYVNTACVSVYTIGFSLYSYYSSFSSAIVSNVIPRIHNIVAGNISNKAKLRDALTEQFVKFGRVQLYIQMLMLTGILFFGKPFIAFWAGEGYENAYYVALILCAANTIPLCQNIGVEIQRAQNKHKFRTVLATIMTVINVILTIILCQKYGEIGATVGTAVAVIAVDIVVMNIYYHRKLYINILSFWKNMAKTAVGFVIPVVFGVAISCLFKMETIVEFGLLVLLYVAVYGLSIWHLSMNREEKQKLLGKFIRK